MDKSLKLEIFLKKGKLRQEIWNKLDKPKTATEIAKEINKHRSAVSRTLLEFEKEGFVKCVNPEDSSFRHYVKKVF
jgi:DNA-binding MarR family transcriptional regulator